MSAVTAVPILPVKRGYLLWLWAGIALVILASLALAWAAPGNGAATFLARNRRHDPGVVETPSGLQYKVLSPGTGAPPTTADVALVMYKGSLTDGSVFDQSQQPLATPLGEQATVPGFEEALRLMPRGSAYRVWIKPTLGYGKEEKRDPATGRVVIPANAVLVFDLTMLDYKSKAELMRARMAQQAGQQPGVAGGASSAPPIAP